MSKTSKITISSAQRLRELGFDPLEALIKLMDDPETTPALRRVVAKRLYRAMEGKSQGDSKRDG